MTDACEQAGVVLGGYDLGLLRWLARGETGQAVSLAGMIRRAYEAGKAAAPGTVTEWGVQFRDGDGCLSTVTSFGSGGIQSELNARGLAGAGRDKNWTGIALCRQVTPWEPAPQDGDGGA
jgi:hypothetical protein